MPGFVEFGVETVEVAVLSFEFGQFGRGSGLEVEHFGHVLTVGGESSEFGAAGLSLLQGGLGEFVEAREVGGQFGGGVRQPQHRIAERLADGHEFGIGGFDIGHGADGLVDEVDGGAGVIVLTAEQQVVGGADGAGDLGGGAELRRLGVEGLVLAGFGPDGVDGLEAAAQPQDAFAAGGGGVLDPGHAGLGLTPGLEGGAVLLGHLG